jgi:hypothetical protein
MVGKPLPTSSAGHDMKVVQETLGLSSVTIAADTYTSVLPQLAHRSDEDVAALVRPARSRHRDAGQGKQPGADVGNPPPPSSKERAQRTLQDPISVPLVASGFCIRWRRDRQIAASRRNQSSDAACIDHRPDWDTWAHPRTRQRAPSTSRSH